MKISLPKWDDEMKHQIKRLLGIYFVACLLRFILSLLLSENPFVMPDEFLYMNLARSLHNEGVFAMRGQPLAYDTFLYSFLISPFYGLPADADLFRWLQLFNAVVMNLAIFPVFFLAKKFTPKLKHAYFVGVLALLVPDMIMGSRIMTEAIGYPLAMFAFLCMYNLLTATVKKPWHAAGTGVLLLLLYYAKSGFIVLPILFSVVLIIKAIKERKEHTFVNAGAFVGAFVVAFAVCYALLALVWKVDYSVQSLYGTYAAENFFEHLGKILPGGLFYLFLIPVAFGILPFIFPLARIKDFPAEQRWIVFIASAGAILMGLGACYMFYASETLNNFGGRIHIRYAFYFMPLFFMFLLSPALKGKKGNSAFVAMGAFLAVMLGVGSFNVLLSNRSYCVDAISLAYATVGETVDTRRIAGILVLAFLLFMLYRVIRFGFGKWEKRISFAFVLLTFLASNIAGYAMNSHNMDKKMSADVRYMVAAAKEDVSSVVVTEARNGYNDNTLGVLDGSLRQTQHYVSINDLCRGLGDYGTTKDITPGKYWVENPQPIPAPEQFLFSYEEQYLVKAAEGAVVEKAPNGYYYRLLPNAQGRVFHSALANVAAGGQLYIGASLWIFDETLLSQETVTVYLTTETKTAGRLSLSSSTEGFYFDLSEGKRAIQATFKTNGAKQLVIYLTQESGDISVVLPEGLFEDSKKQQ